mgnify:CR=1 FL=1
MDKTMVNGITIIYDDSCLDKIDEIKETIKNNTEMFLSVMRGSTVLSLIPNEDETCAFLGVDEFDEFFMTLMKNSFDTEDNKRLLNEPALSSAIYLEFLRRKYGVVGYFDDLGTASIADECFYDIVDYMYFGKKGSFNEFVSYLKVKDREEDIAEWMVEANRFSAYNFLLDGILTHLRVNGLEAVGDIADVVSMMLNQTYETIFGNFNVKPVAIPEVTPEECDKLFYEFLDDIEAPSSWRDSYDELKKDNRLTYRKAVNEAEVSYCGISSDGKGSIGIIVKDNLTDFKNLVHEFAHYVALKDGSDVESSISELPSIFFENMALRFLKKKGYSDVVISTIVRDRTFNNRDLSPSMLSIFSDVALYANKGIVTKEDKIKVYQGIVRQMVENRKILAEKGIELKNLPNINFSDQEIEKMTCNDCDKLTLAFLAEGHSLLNGYQYMVDTFVAVKILEKVDDDSTVVPEMFRITEELSKTHLSDILEKFKIKDVFAKEGTKFKIKEKDN